MKKMTIVLLAVIVSVILIFTACDKNDKDKDLITTTERATTTERVTTTEPERTTVTDMLTSDPTSDNAGAPESTSNDSALADAVEDAADGVADANERIADGVRDAQNNNG